MSSPTRSPVSLRSALLAALSEARAEVAEDFAAILLKTIGDTPEARVLAASLDRVVDAAFALAAARVLARSPQLARVSAPAALEAA